MGARTSAVFLDRDGVINEVVVRDGKPASPRTLDEFRFVDGIMEALERLRVAGYRLFVLSNQPDVARGLLDRSVLDRMTRRIVTALPVERVLTCAHDEKDGCACRKPRPGMLHQVAAAEGSGTRGRTCRPAGGRVAGRSSSGGSTMTGLKRITWWLP